MNRCRGGSSCICVCQIHGIVIIDIDDIDIIILHVLVHVCHCAPPLLALLPGPRQVTEFITGSLSVQCHDIDILVFVS